MKRIVPLIILLIFSSSFAGDWAQYMGPRRDGSVAAPGLFSGEKITLEQLWIKPLGSGFSGISVANGKLYAMHAEPVGELAAMSPAISGSGMDRITCFDAATGKVLWSYGYGKAFAKVGNSEPGPLSTPTVDGNRVYGLGAHGELFCLDTSNGNPVWKINIVEELGSKPREVGVTTSPLIYGYYLILNVGDQNNKGIAAFNKTTGKLAWSMGAEAITFQTPALITHNGEKQVLSLSKDKMRGLEPTTGRLIWEEQSRDWIQAIPIGQDKILSGNYHGFALYQYTGMYNLFNIREVWYNENMTLEYNMPVHHQGYLYGFKRGFLTCLNLESGEKVWNSREPGNGMAILVDGHLAITTYKNGGFHIARASSKGYEERASLDLFEKGGLTAPSYADGVFYIRSYAQIAAVKVK